MNIKTFIIIDDIDADKDIYFVNVHRNEDMFGVNDLESDKIVVESQVTNKDMNLSVDEVTLAQALATLKSAKVSIVIPTTAATTITAVSSRPRAKGIVFVSLQQPTQVKDKGKGKMVKEEPVKKMSKKSHSSLMKNLLSSYKLKKMKKKGLPGKKLKKLQAQEQEELSDVEKDTLFLQLLEKRRKHFAAKKAEKKRNIPPTKAQQRSFMCTYLKNIEGWKPKDLKNKSFSSKKAEAETTQESSSKRAGEALEQENSKKQKVDDDKETEELKQCMEIISDDGDDVTIEATPLFTKFPTIVDYKIYKEVKKSYLQIIIADGNSQMYLTFGKMLKNFNREDL
ncbi:hypothetical protein Tco_1389460 [Tanacetum coccineum]